MIRCTLLLRYAPCAVALLIATGAGAQSLNVDLDFFAGPPEAGNGAPSSNFGGAAGQPGFWNRVDAAGPRQATPLAGLDGNLTSATMQAPGGSGGAGGSGWQGNTGDYALLLNDYARVGDEIRYHFLGMLPGHYLVYTYAVDAGGQVIPAEVWVPGSTTANPQVVTGPMPGNAFARGITHSVHELELTTGSFEIILRNQVQGPPNAAVNGFQIVAVPEPTSVLACLAGVGWILKGSLVAFAARTEGSSC